MTANKPDTLSWHPDDIAVWPDGCWCHNSEIETMGWKSDDYELVRREDETRLEELGILDEIG